MVYSGVLKTKFVGSEESAVTPSSRCSASGVRTVVLVDVPLAFASQAEQFSDLNIIRCKAEPNTVVSLCEKSLPCILIADEKFILALPSALRQELLKQRDQMQIIAVNSAEFSYAELLQLGCSGAIHPDMTCVALRRAIDALDRGELWFPRKVLSDAIRNLAQTLEPNLTRREKEILQMISDGYSNGEIAKALFITRDTVRWHQRSLYSKIGTRNRKEVAAFYKNERRAS
jgi:DNA-binding NarL/FixJ family response regulator